MALEKLTWQTCWHWISMVFSSIRCLNHSQIANVRIRITNLFAGIKSFSYLHQNRFIYVGMQTATKMPTCNGVKSLKSNTMNKQRFDREIFQSATLHSLWFGRTWTWFGSVQHMHHADDFPTTLFERRLKALNGFVWLVVFGWHCFALSSSIRCIGRLMSDKYVCKCVALL